MGQTFKKRRIKYMGNRIVISESQYSRLFLNEQELPPSFKKGLDKDKQLNLNDPNGLEGWLKNGQVDDEGVNNVDKKGGNEDVSNDNYFNTPNVIEKLPFYLENAPEWFDKESARFLDDPMGSGGVYVDKYGSTYGEWNSDRKKPLSNDEKKKINDFKRESDQIKRNAMMSAMEKIVPLTQDEKLSLLNKKYSDSIGDTNKSIEYGIKQRSGLVYNPYTKEWESPTDKPKKTSQTSTYCNYRHIQYCKKKGEVAMVKNFSGKELNSLLPNQPVPWTDSEKYPICVCGDERTKMSAGSDYDDKYLQQKREESYKTDIKRMLMMSGECDEDCYNNMVSIANYVGGCANDYHCVLDLLSIVSLAIPGVGLAVSAGLDFLNAGAYGLEGLTAKNTADRDAAYLAGGLTMLGGILGGGIGQTRRIIKYGSKKPKIFNYASDVMSTVQKEFKGVKNLKSVKDKTKLAEIYKEAKQIHKMSDDDIKIAHDLLKYYKKLDPAIVKEYTKAMGELKKLSSVDKGNLIKLVRNESFQKLVKNSGNDILTSLKKYMSKVAKKEAVMEGALFIALTEVMEQPSVQKWIGEKYKMLMYSGRKDIRGLVEKEGYEWDGTKKVFGAVVKGTPEYSKEQSGEDNTKLKQAWLKGWRPDKEPIEWLLKNPKYQTKGFKKSYGKYTGDDKVVRKVRPKDNKDVEDGVKYYDTEEELNKVNSMDDNVTEDEIETTGSIYEKYL